MPDQNNTLIDNLLKQRQDGLYAYAQATRELINMGVIIGRASDGALTLPSSFERYLDKYEVSNMEFEWEVEYTDGSVLRQFDNNSGIEVQHHFGDIDQSKLQSISFISNFVWPTDNREQRIIVRLNWQTGLFEFMNGFASQDVLAATTMNPLPGEKKLIMFTRKRQSSMVGDIPEEFREFFPAVDEFYYYNRFVLGYETDSGKKMVIIEPNGTIKLFDN